MVWVFILQLSHSVLIFRVDVFVAWSEDKTRWSSRSYANETNVENKGSSIIILTTGISMRSCGCMFTKAEFWLINKQCTAFPAFRLRFPEYYFLIVKYSWIKIWYDRLGCKCWFRLVAKKQTPFEQIQSSQHYQTPLALFAVSFLTLYLNFS